MKSLNKVLGIIPARLGSTRIPEKMLQDLGGKTLIERTIERTKNATMLDQLVVSTDAQEIAELAEAAGLKVFMTDPELPTGTDRVAATLELFTDFEPDIVVNVWGDEPLYPSSVIDDVANALIEDEEAVAVVAADRITEEKLVEEPSIVQVLTDLNDTVLCFSRCPVPYGHTTEPYDHYHVIGAMAMRADFLKTFVDLPRTPIERREGVEQMRILEHGYKMKAVRGDFKNLGVNTPAELEIVREIYKKRESDNDNVK